MVTDANSACNGQAGTSQRGESHISQVRSRTDPAHGPIGLGPASLIGFSLQGRAAPPPPSHVALPEGFAPGHPCGATLPHPATPVQPPPTSRCAARRLAVGRSGGRPRRAGGAARAVGTAWPPAGGRWGGAAGVVAPQGRVHCLSAWCTLEALCLPLLLLCADLLDSFGVCRRLHGAFLHTDSLQLGAGTSLIWRFYQKSSPHVRAACVVFAGVPSHSGIFSLLHGGDGDTNLQSGPQREIDAIPAVPRTQSAGRSSPVRPIGYPLLERHARQTSTILARHPPSGLAECQTGGRRSHPSCAR